MDPCSPDLEGKVAGLVTAAPADFAARVLTGLGLPAEPPHRYLEVDGPVGPMVVAFSPAGVTSSALLATLAGGLDEFVERYVAEHGVVLRATRVALAGLDRSLHAGRPVGLELDLRRLSPFARAVLHVATRIPRGQVRPYSWVAREIDRPRAARAVGTALARNPVPLIVPCHRVVRSDGGIGEYAFGSEMKRRLLDHEGVERYAGGSVATRSGTSGSAR